MNDRGKRFLLYGMFAAALAIFGFVVVVVIYAPNLRKPETLSIGLEQEYWRTDIPPEELGPSQIINIPVIRMDGKTYRQTMFQRSCTPYLEGDLGFNEYLEIIERNGFDALVATTLFFNGQEMLVHEDCVSIFVEKGDMPEYIALLRDE